MYPFRTKIFEQNLIKVNLYSFINIVYNSFLCSARKFKNFIHHCQLYGSTYNFGMIFYPEWHNANLSENFLSEYEINKMGTWLIL
jgi:hypothetical protein